MTQRTKNTAAKKRRNITYAWIFGLALIVFLLIYFERTELLYVLATLGVTSLLVIVALADLGVSEHSNSPAMTDAQGASSGVSSRTPKLANK
jgi:hypothetical protein